MPQAKFLKAQINSDTGLPYLALIDGITPDPDYTVTEWADNYRILPKVSSKESGKYRSSRTPYLVEIMDCLSANSPVQEICVMKATQLGFTEVGNNWFFYIVDLVQGPMMMVFPTGKLAEEHSKQKIAPSIQDTERIRQKIKDSRTRDSGNTVTVKEFPGGILFLYGSESLSGARSKPIRFLFLDDIDGFSIYITNEGDAVDRFSARTDTYEILKKIYSVSTPTIKGMSRIEGIFNESDQRYYEVPCPFCLNLQKLEWGGRDTKFGIKFDRNKKGLIKQIWYECKFCNKKIPERHKTQMMAIEFGAKWKPTYPEREKRGYQISGLYAPLGWKSWTAIATQFLDVRGNQERLKVWNNTRMGLPFEQRGSQPEWIKLKSRAEPYEILTVPEKGLLLTAGVDTQDNRLICSVYAWGKGEESWLVYHGELYGDPAQGDVWKELDSVLERSYRHNSGADLRIESMAIDTGGHRTQAVYNYCRARMPRVIAVRGAPKPGRPVISNAPSLQDVDFSGAKIEKGVQLWSVGSDTAKAMIYGRLNLQEPGPGYVHFPIGMQDEFYMQLTAEKIITEFRKGFPHPVWVKTRERNDALDTFVYAYAAAIRAGISILEWDEIEKLIKSQSVPVSDDFGQKESPKGGFLGDHKNFLG